MVSEEYADRVEFALLTSLPSMDTRVVTSGPENCEYVLNAVSYTEGVPQTFEEIEGRPDKEEWYKAIEEELSALKESGTWEYAELPRGKRAIGSRWVFAVKHDSAGEIERYKARLVVKGCSQKPGQDFNETYAPVAKLSTFRVLLSVCNYRKFHLHQLDVKNAFLNGILKEEIYMQIPKGVEPRTGEVCKLKRTLYGLKQAPMEWNARFDMFVRDLGFTPCATDRCLYVSVNENVTMYLLLYVDDFIIASNDMGALNNVKEILKNEFKMRDLGELNYFLGIKIERHGESLFLSQTSYIEKLINRFKMSTCKPKLTPMPAKPFQDIQSNPMALKPYRELIGCLMYACLATRPDLCAAVNYFSQFQTKATVALWEGLKRIIRYLQGTKNLGLWFKGQTDTVLVGYADASWANCIDRKSVSGYLFKTYGDLVVWASRKQRTVAQSSTEAEYIAIASAGTEYLWLIQLLAEMKVTIQEPVIIYEDNQSCISALESWDQKRLKHIDIKYHFIKELVKNKLISVKYVPTEDQTADIFTKGLAWDLFKNHRIALGMCEVN